ncbi:phosphate acyltransferase [Acidaminobacterium chupaoyuni]
MIKNLSQLTQEAQKGKTMRLAVAASHDEDVLKAVSQARALGLCSAVLVGDGAKTREILARLGESEADYQIIEAQTPAECAALAVAQIRGGNADFLMKGILGTADLMRAVIDKEHGLRTGRLISHVMLYEMPNFDRILYLTDGGMNTYPNLEQKADILENAAHVCRAMGMEKTYAACVCGAEVVNPKIQATVDADALAHMTERFEPLGLHVEGPVGLDLAISPEACHHKGYAGEGGGKADILLVPTYEVGNGIGKTLTYFANAASAGIIMGATVPIILVSRADTAETKRNSIALGCIIARTQA